MNPYLVGYDQFISRPNLERNRTGKSSPPVSWLKAFLSFQILYPLVPPADAHPNISQPSHPVFMANPVTRTAALVTRTNTPPAPSETAQSSVSVQQVTEADGSRSIDISFPMPSGELGYQLAPADNTNTASANARPQTPTTLNIFARPSGAATGQSEPPAVEITISTQSVHCT